MKKLWIAKYRPTHVKDVIVTNARDRLKFDMFAVEKEIPNLLMYGGPGTGKSSMSLALMRDLGIDKTDILKINCSDEKIDAMRDKVKNFAMTMSIGKFKVVRLEELDGIGHDAQRMLRDLIESTERSCRYIATCNHINKIMIELRSRFQEFKFNAPSREDVFIRAADILTQEGIQPREDHERLEDVGGFSIDDLEKYIIAGYPDFRKIIQLLQQHSFGVGMPDVGKTTYGATNYVVPKPHLLPFKDAASMGRDWKMQLLPLLEADDLKGARKLVCETATQNELIDVYRFLYDNLHRIKKLKKQDDAIVLIAQYQYQHGFVSDPELQIAALFVELSNLM